MKRIVFDIETGPLPEEQLQKMMPEFEASKTLKDPAKIEADLAGKKADWLSRAALSATTGQILAIGYWDEGKIELIHDGEEKILSDWWKRFGDRTILTFVGHNARGFDLPFIVRRSIINGIRIPWIHIMRGRWITERIDDTMERWSCGEYGNRISLDVLARSLGVGAKTGSGADFARLYHDPKTRGKALAYLENDIKITAAVASRLGMLDAENPSRGMGRKFSMLKGEI